MKNKNVTTTRRRFIKKSAGTALVFGAGIAGSDAAILSSVSVLSGSCTITHSTQSGTCTLNCSPASSCNWECKDTMFTKVTKGAVSVGGAEPSLQKSIDCYVPGP